MTVFIHAELIHNVSITGPTGPWLTDNKPYTLTCLTFSEVTQDVKWLDPNGKKVVSHDAWTLEETVGGKYTTVKLTFNKLNTSHTGTYLCVSKTLKPSSQKSVHWNVTIKRESDQLIIVLQLS